jgi:hypothetical protein
VVETLTPVIAAKLRKRKAAAKVDTVPTGFSLPAAHLANSSVILSRTNFQHRNSAISLDDQTSGLTLKFLETNDVVPFVPRMIIPIIHMT